MSTPLTVLESSRRLVIIWGCSAALIVALFLVGWIAYSLTPSNQLTPEFLNNYSADYRYYLLSQPKKACGYLAAAAVAPFLAMSLCYFGRKYVHTFSGIQLDTSISWIMCLTSLVFALFLLITVSIPYPVEGMPPTWLGYKWYFSTTLFFTLTRFITLIGALYVYRQMTLRDFTIRNRNISTAIILAIIVLILPTCFYTPGQITEDWTYAFDLNSLTQACAHASVGEHIYTDYSHVYGGYAEFLAPVLRLIPRDLESFLSIFGIINTIPWIFLCLTSRLLIRSASLILLSNLSFLTIVAVNLGNNYYQSTAIRLFFPGLFIFLACLYLRSGDLKYFLGATLCSAISSIWNLDSGLVIWVSWTGTLAVRRWYQSHRMGQSPLAWLGSAKEVIIQLLSLAGAWILFDFYLRIASGNWPDMDEVFVFQKAYGSSGFHCFPLMIPDAWMVAVAFFAINFVIVGLNYLNRTASWRTHVLFMMTLIEIGTFSYFMGRSCESNLLSASYLVPMSLGMVLAETKFFVKRSKFPSETRTVTLPGFLILVWGALVIILALPDIVGRDEVFFKTIFTSKLETPIQQNVKFICSHSLPGEDVFIFSNQSGIYYFMSATRCSINVPSSSEWTSRVSFLTMVDAFNAKRVKKVFFDEDVFDYPLYMMPLYNSVRKAIESHYHVIAVNPSGRIRCYIAD